jgi:hypothetical protein
MFSALYDRRKSTFDKHITPCMAYYRFNFMGIYLEFAINHTIQNTRKPRNKLMQFLFYKKITE